MAEIVVGVLSKVFTQVAASTSDVIIDTINKTELRSFKWILTIEGDTTDNVSSSEILVVYKSSNDDINYNEYSIIGDVVDYDITVEISGNDIRLVIDNNETEILNVRVLRYII